MSNCCQEKSTSPIVEICVFVVKHLCMYFDNRCFVYMQPAILYVCSCIICLYAHVP